MTCNSCRQVVIGACLDDVTLRITPGRDHLWQVDSATDADGETLTGTLVITIGTLVFDLELVNGATTFELSKEDAAEDLIDARINIDHLALDETLTALGEGVVVRA
jgi:hypothetical protein